MASGGLPEGWTIAHGQPWRVHRRWVTTLGRQTAGRRIRRVVLGQAAPGMELDDLPSDLEDLVLSVLGWLLKIVFILVVVPVYLVFVWTWGLFEVLGRVLLRRPWRVDAFGRDATQLRWKANGFTAAGQLRDGLRTSLPQGHAPGDVEVKEGPDLS